jgi:phosphonate transport system substrate-binding protein
MQSSSGRMCFRKAVMALLSLAAFAAGTLRAEDGYSFAVVPQFSQRQIYTTWNPIVEEIARRTGIKLNLLTTLTVPQYEHGLSQGTFDFAYANPYHIMRESRRQGYVPLVRDKVPLTGILVVRKDNPAQTPADLNGKVLAVPSPNALGASLLLQADLAQVFRTRMTLSNMKTHTSVYLAVVNGLADAGGGVQKTLEQQDENVRGALRVLYTARPMPSHPVAAHPRVPPAVREAVRKALLEMAATTQGEELLARVPMTAPVSASIEDYLAMKSWGLEKYWVEEGN